MIKNKIRRTEMVDKFLIKKTYDLIADIVNYYVIKLCQSYSSYFFLFFCCDTEGWFGRISQTVYLFRNSPNTPFWK